MSFGIAEFPKRLSVVTACHRLSARRILGSKQYGNGFIDSVCVEDAHTYIPFPSIQPGLTYVRIGNKAAKLE